MYTLDDLLGTDERVSLCACGRFCLELLDKGDALASVVLVDVDVLHDLVGEASESVALIEAVPCLPEPKHGLADQILDVILSLAVSVCHLSEPWELADEFTREVHRSSLVFVLARCGSFLSCARLPVSLCR